MAIITTFTISCDKCHRRKDSASFGKPMTNADAMDYFKKQGWTEVKDMHYCSMCGG